MNRDGALPALAAHYFDGQQAKPQAVHLTVQGGQLHIDGDGVALRVPVRRVSWPERQRHGTRQAYLPGHGMLSHADAATAFLYGSVAHAVLALVAKTELAAAYVAFVELFPFA